MKTQISKRVNNFRNNISLARYTNPFAVIYIEAALKTHEEPIMNLEYEIHKVREKIKKLNRSENIRNIQLRARWAELNFIKNLR